jgi:hypothetical protein
MEQSPSWQADSHSHIEAIPEVKLSFSQEPLTAPYPEPDESVSHPPKLSP